MSYFTVTQPIKGVFRIEDRANVFATLLVGTHRALLIDTCVGMGDLRAVVERLTTLPYTVVVSHGHFDHVGGARHFDWVYIPQEELEYARYSMNEHIRRSVFASLQAFSQEVGTDEQAFLAYSMENLRILPKDEVFHLGGLHAVQVPLPNHSPGSVGFLCPELELLISADSVAPMTYLFFPESSTVKEHITLLKQVRNLPFQHILAAHCPRLIPRSELELYIECAEHIDPHQTHRFRDDNVPEFVGRMYVHQSLTGDGSAIIVYNPEKLDL